MKSPARARIGQNEEKSMQHEKTWNRLRSSIVDNKVSV